MGLIANRRDQDCYENRLLEYLTEYLNKTGYSRNKKVFYGQAKLFEFVKTEKNDFDYFNVHLKKYFKEKDYIKNENVQLQIPMEVGEIFLRTHKIKELVRKIKHERLNKI